MKGSIRLRSKGSWEITIDTGRDVATGKRLRHFESVQGTKKDAQRRLYEIIYTLLSKVPMSGLAGSRSPSSLGSGSGTTSERIPRLEHMNGMRKS